MLIKRSNLKKLMIKSVLSVFSVSLLLSLSACSSEQETTAVEPVAEESTANAEVVKTEVVETEPTVVESTETPIVETTDAENADAATAETEVLAVNAGAQLYEAQCKVCHANGLLNAPKYGDKVAWAPALAKDKQTLYSHSAQGFNKMPAQAVNGVSEAQVQASVDYMLAAVS